LLASRSPCRLAIEARNASPERGRPCESVLRARSRAFCAASDSTLRTASSSARRSRVISDSVSGGSTLRNWAIKAERARS